MAQEKSLEGSITSTAITRRPPVPIPEKATRWRGRAASRRLMVRLGPACVAVAIGGAWGAMPVSGQKPPRRPLCAQFRCTTLELRGRVRIFEARERRTRYPNFRGVFAQWMSRRQVTELGDLAGESVYLIREPPPVLGGRFVAYVVRNEERYPLTPGYEDLTRLDVKTRRRLNIDCRGPARCEFAHGTVGITDLALLPDGAMAWIVRGGREAPDVYEVWELGKTATRPTKITTSEAVEPKSLALVPGHLYWTEGGEPREAKVE